MKGVKINRKLIADNLEAPLDYKELKKAATILRAINHPLRQRMMEIINTEEEVNVTKLYVELRLEQSVASQHLAILRKDKFVKTYRKGKYIYYEINHERMDRINELIKEINNY